jgi:hypothetical protein
LLRKECVLARKLKKKRNRYFLINILLYKVCRNIETEKGKSECEKRQKKHLENLSKEIEKLAFEVLEKGYEKLTALKKKERKNGNS